MNESLQLDMDAFLPLREVVFNTLRDAILKGEIEPGERLMELHLAKRLGVSRTPVREAIRMLEQEGLAVNLPRKGAHVARMTEKDLEDVLEIRDALDELAVTSAAKRITEKQVRVLRRAMLTFEDAIGQADIREIVDADEAFHNVIYEIAGNPKLSNIINNLREQIYRYRYEYIKDKADHEKLIEEHRKIFEGLRDGEVEFVKEVMKEHLANQVEAVREMIHAQTQEAEVLKKSLKVEDENL